jgi:hypothetical protein
MKKQTNAAVKAHLLWSALILLLLLVTCAIPFALAQRQSVKQSVPGQGVVTVKGMSEPGLAPGTNNGAENCPLKSQKKRFFGSGDGYTERSFSRRRPQRESSHAYFYGN